MANENWEEISVWDVEEDMDMDLTQRITVHTVHHLNSDNPDDAEDSEYQLVQAHKYPTYAAATKWGGRRKNKKSISINVDDVVEKKQEEGKENIRKGVVLGAPAKPTNDNTSSSNILKGDHEVDYDDCNNKHPSLSCIPTSPPPSDPDPVDISKSLTRRHNNHVHKLSNQRLLNQMVVDPVLGAEFVKGDTNRDPEFKRYKMLKKSMRHRKDRKRGNGGAADKLRVEVW